MTIISLPKNMEDIVEPEALSEDYYKMRIVEEPVIEANKKKKVGGDSAPGAGDNLILSLRVISDDPEQQGRTFKKWMGLVTPADKDNYTSLGQSMEDFKISMLGKVQTGFSGVPAEGNEIDLQAGMEAWVYVTRGLDDAGQRFVNDLDFMQDIKPV